MVLMTRQSRNTIDAVRTSLLVILVGCSAPAKPTPPAPVANTTPGPAVELAKVDPACDECVERGKKMLQAPVVTADDPVTAAAANSRALELFRTACAQSHLVGCEMVGTLLLDNSYYGLTKDDASAAIAFGRACELANAHACYRLGFVYWEGLVDHVVENGQVRRFKWPDDKQVGVRFLHHACNDLQQRDACQLLEELEQAGAI